MDFTATDTAQLTDISIRSVNSNCPKARSCITQICEHESPMQGFIHGHVALAIVIHSDGWRGLTGWWISALTSILRFTTVITNLHVVSSINGIESFWSFTKKAFGKV